MATISLGFNLSASAVQMASGINAGVVELQKLGYAAKKTQQDVSTLKTIELSRAFISTVQAAAGAFSQFISGTAGAVASIDDLSKRTGVTTDVLQAYSLAANQSGVGIETFGKAVQRLTINLGEAQTGNKTAIKSFADLGLSVTDLAQLNPEQAFNSVFAAISKLPGPAQQAAAAVSLFGKSGGDLVPLFQEGATYLQQMTAEAKRLGISLSPQQFAAIALLDDSLQKTQLTLQGFSARLLAEFAPSLKKAAEDAATFIASIDVKQVASAATQAIQDLGAVFQILAAAAAPLAGNILPLIGGYLAFINRQVIASGLKSLGSVFVSAAAAAFGYAGSAATAAAATTALAVSVRGLLVSTGIGALVVVLGLAAGAAIDWAVSSNTSADAATSGVQETKKAMDDLRKSVAATALQTEEFGQKAKDALKVPTFTAKDLAQESIDEANAAIKSLAKELGGLDRVPANLLAQFGELKNYAEGITSDVQDQGAAIGFAAQQAKSLTQEARTLADAQKAAADAAKEAATAAKKAAEEARQRTAELANAGLSDAEKSRVQLNRDLLSIASEQRAAEEAIAAARKAGDANGISDAKERLRLSQLAIKSLAKELGGLDRVPANLLAQFGELKNYAEGITSDVQDQGAAIGFAAQQAKSLTQEARTLADAQKAAADAAKEAATAAKKAAEEARQRTAELANAGLSDAEKSRVQLNRDLLSIASEQRAAEEAIAAARKAGDANGISDAKERLRLSQLAVKEAKAQDRERQLQSLGIDDNLLKPATTLADRFKAVRQAFDKKLIDGGEARQALRNLAQEGIDIRKDIAAELSRPAASALNANDIRTNEGISSLFALTREDPAIAQRREQLTKLEQIRQAIAATGANPVDILGA